MKTSEILNYLVANKSEFEREFGVTKIGLFGSFARNQDQEGSDIDIVVEMSKPDLLSLVGIKQMIEEQLKANVDIVRYRHRMNQALKNRIDKEALYV